MMDTTMLAVLTATASGLLAGALVTEAFVLVPFWKKMNAQDFLRLHPSLSPILFRFFAPLTVIGTTLPLAACATEWLFLGSARWLWSISAACGIGLICFYLGFFRHANIRVAESETEQDLSVTLGTWATMHWLRTIVAVIGFVFSAAALIKY